jgi:ubiquinone/menaquinone biosynthesis C-methylase UbiE
VSYARRSVPGGDACHFDRLAATYDELRGGTGRLTAAIADENEPTGRLLDVGCGTGRVVDELARHYSIDGYGVEPSRAMLDVARARVRGVTFVEGRAEDLPFGTRSSTER